MRIPHELVTSSLEKIWTEGVTTGETSLLETFLAAKLMESRGSAPSITIANQVVSDLFTDFKDHPYGRLYPFRSTKQKKPIWNSAEDSGRKTVWNYGTRQRGKALFIKDHFENGLREDASTILKESITHRLDPIDLAIVLLRNDEVNSLAPADLIENLKKKFNLSDQELACLSRLESPDWKTRSLDDTGTPWTPENLQEDWKPSNKKRNAESTETPEGKTAHSLEDNAEVIVDSRVLRMLQTSISTYSAVIAVGPPGTGKTTLIEQLAEKAAAHPEMFGFQIAPKRPLIVTPDESWTTKELVGGETISQGELTFEPGYILNAIAQDRWIVLDEINRADMDRIFGALFTWLSGKPVTIGKVKVAQCQKTIILGWSGKPDSEVIEGEESIKYLAGDDWRLLGTYNATDAAKVFRFGHALGRRFVRVPIPAADAEHILEATQKKCAGLPEAVTDKIINIYKSHLEIEPLGPALFLRIPSYISASGLDRNSSLDDEFQNLLAESYVINLGAYLNKLDEIQLEGLKSRLVSTHAIFSENQWNWIWSMSQNMSS